MRILVTASGGCSNAQRTAHSLKQLRLSEKRSPSLSGLRCCPNHLRSYPAHEPSPRTFVPDRPAGPELSRSLISAQFATT